MFRLVPTRLPVALWAVTALALALAGARATGASSAASAETTSAAPAHRAGTAFTASSRLALITEPQDGIAAVLSAVKGARHEVDVGDVRGRAIPSSNAALVVDEQRGVAVRVLLNGGYYGHGFPQDQAAYDYLKAHGVPVRWTPSYFALTHQKTLVADGRAYILTFNLTPQYYASSRDFGVVDSILGDDAAIERTFDADWSGQRITAPNGADLVWSPGSQDALVGLIQSATGSVDIYNASRSRSPPSGRRLGRGAPLLRCRPYRRVRGELDFRHPRGDPAPPLPPLRRTRCARPWTTRSGCVPAAQQPNWPELDYVARIRALLEAVPPITVAVEVDRLQERLGAVARGEAFLLQGGDCAETFIDNTEEHLRGRIRTLLQMAVVLTYGTSMPLVKLVAHRRSVRQAAAVPTPTPPAFRPIAETWSTHSSATVAGQRPDPGRMIRAFANAAAAMNLARAITGAGLADLHRLQEWNMDFVRRSSAGERYERVATEIDRSLRFMSACGVDDVSLRMVEMYSSHELLVLDYERAMLPTQLRAPV